MFISTSFTGLFNITNLIHHLFSTYYTQNQWCAGNSNLTASNIKKDITIFGVKGTYVETTRWIVKNGALVNGVGMEYTNKYNPNDEGTPASSHKASVNPTTRTVNGNTYIRTQYVPVGNDRNHNYWYFSNVGGRLFNYTGSSTSNWKIPSIHIDWAAEGNGSRNLCIYYAFGGGGGFSKIKNDAIWTWYSEIHTGSIDVTSITSTTSGIPVYTGWTGAELKSGTILIAIAVGSSSHSFEFYIRNLWVNTKSWI